MADTGVSGTALEPRHSQRPLHRPRHLRRVLLSASFVTSAVVLGALVTPAAVSAASQTDAAQRQRDTTMEVELGVNGVVPATKRVPVRLKITSKRARRATLRVSSMGEPVETEVELAADATTTVDFSVALSSFLDVNLFAGGKAIANRSMEVGTDPGQTIIAVGRSLFANGAPRTSPTIGGIQQARLVELTDELIDRPGILGIVSGVVLSAKDVDGLSKQSIDALRRWVWTGGDLAIDTAKTNTLPVVGLPATGANTAVGAGWVRFTEGGADAGKWSEILEPAVIRARNQGGVDDMFDMWGGRQVITLTEPVTANSKSGDDDIAIDPDQGGGAVPVRTIDLIEVQFMSVWVIVFAMFGSALAGGPIAWYVLRTRTRRRWMWLTAPGIPLLAATLLVGIGQGILTRATTRVVAAVDSTPWGPVGSIEAGLRKSTELSLGGRAELLGSTPPAHVRSDGSTQTATITLPRNGFGSVALGSVSLESGPSIEVKAVAKDNDLVTVTVTNHSQGIFRDVQIAGNGRARKFKSVSAGKSVTMDYRTGSDMGLFASMFETIVGMNEAQPGAAFRSVVGPPESRGLVQVIGVVSNPIKTTLLNSDAFNSDATSVVRIVAPITPGAQGVGSDTSAIRIDGLGGWSNLQISELANQGVMIVGVSPVGDDPGLDADQDGIPEIDGPEYVRLAFPTGRPESVCGVTTQAHQVDYWNGTSWTPLAKSGELYRDQRIRGIDGKTTEMQGWMLPGVDAGEMLHLRVSGRKLFGPPTMMFACGAPQ